MVTYPVNKVNQFSNNWGDAVDFMNTKLTKVSEDSQLCDDHQALTKDKLK